MPKVVEISGLPSPVHLHVKDIFMALEGDDEAKEKVIAALYQDRCKWLDGEVVIRWQDELHTPVKVVDKWSSFHKSELPAF